MHATQSVARQSQLRLSFRTLQPGNALRDALRQKSTLHRRSQNLPRSLPLKKPEIPVE
ncbi:DUF1534 domain-containing protein [Pseudomonas syringae pv. tomato]|nr:DUF1534 domain-containing protein [Pseudomonas syringae pv. tomato]PYD05714.1 hypothetical protein DND90_19840 [Pseudomonas syringae pv. maculicola]QBI65486.1 DUF1534 domain-containing protein [Pseudomonas syringae]TES59953.1 DUF1534 domain-containing protein [Pseudomonas syringae pv. tomato]TES62143.1 DUF1534 domain-containing protein [Pseudomonas syringae pv. tomato]